MSNLIETTFTRYRGDTSDIPLLLVDPSTGSPFNPTGSVMIFTIKAVAGAPDATALIQKISTAGGFTVVVAAAGSISVQLVPADFTNIVADVAYHFDVQAQVTSTGAVKTVARGTITFNGDVTQGTTISIPTTVVNPDAIGAGADATFTADLVSGLQSYDVVFDPELSAAPSIVIPTVSMDDDSGEIFSASVDASSITATGCTIWLSGVPSASAGKLKGIVFA